MRGWWTSTAEVEPRVGGRLTVWFQDRSIAMVHAYEVLDRDGHVRITCVDNVANPDWQGTTLDWRWREQPGGVELRLGHHHWDPDSELYDECDAGWPRFLRSIKLLAETGRGDPVD